MLLSGPCLHLNTKWKLTKCRPWPFILVITSVIESNCFIAIPLFTSSFIVEDEMLSLRIADTCNQIFIGDLKGFCKYSVDRVENQLQDKRLMIKPYYCICHKVSGISILNVFCTVWILHSNHIPIFNSKCATFFFFLVQQIFFPRVGQYEVPQLPNKGRNIVLQVKLPFLFCFVA